MNNGIKENFKDERLLDVLYNERITWEYILKGTDDADLRKDVEDIITLINKFDERKRTEVQVDILKKELGSSDNSPGEVKE